MHITITLHADMVDGILETATVPVAGGCGWRTFNAVVRRQISELVSTEAGAHIAAHTMMTSP